MLGGSLGQPRKGLVRRRAVMDAMQDIALRGVERVLAYQRLQGLGVIDFDHPYAAVLAVAEAEMALERVAQQNARPETLFDGSLVRVIEPPPCSNHLGRAVGVSIIEPRGDALEAWLSRSGITAGPIFRRIRRDDRVAEPLSPAAVRDIVKARAAEAGLPDDFSAHSVRSGFVTEAARQNIPIGETMALTGHASVATVVGYFRTASSLESKAARLLGEDS